MSSMSNQSQAPLFPGASASTSTSVEGENRFIKKIKESPILPLATLGFLGIGGYRVYKATQSTGGQKLSFFLIHTRLAAQGFAVAVLGSLVLYSLGERAYNKVVLGKKFGEE